MTCDDNVHADIYRRGWEAGRVTGEGHGYTCDLCAWGRDKVRTVNEYAQHLRREHCRVTGEGLHEHDAERCSDCEDVHNRAIAEPHDCAQLLDVERLARALLEVAPGRYADDWPDDDPEIVGPFAWEEATAIARKYTADNPTFADLPADMQIKQAPVTLIEMTLPITKGLDYMCPNCVTPWKCNGPHIPE